MPDSAEMGIDESALLPAIPPLQRLALAYAPSRARPATLALLALDSRLAAVLRSASAPLLAQIRLAWWRDRLGEDRAAGPRGEPVLAALRDSGLEARALVPLVDGWEAMTGEQPLAASAFELLAEGRGQAFAALATALGCGDHADSAYLRGRAWALADLAERVSNAEEREGARRLAEAEEARSHSLPRALRPLAVLDGVSRRRLRRGAAGALAPGDLLTAIRLGIAGR